jgi:isoquinoline 1-oxidoreductase beta subunit
MNPQNTPGAVLSRRQFLAASGGLTFAVTVGAPLQESIAASAPQASASMGAWVRINPDDWITIYNPAAEMGQGSMTALPVIVAEEMDADWAKVRIEQAPVERETYGNPTWFGGRMLTVGSRTVQGYYHALRIAGAQVRAVLLENAARVMDVPVGELTTEPSVVVHTASGRRLSYGRIAAATPASARVPEVSDADLKDRKDFRLIGTAMHRRDIPDKVMGKAIYGIDVQRPGMVYAVMTRCPVNGSRPVDSNAAEIKQKPGVIDVVALDYGIAVVSETVEGALSARKALKITWSEDAPARRFDSEASFARYREIAQSAGGSTMTINASGNPEGAFARAAKIYSAE